MAIYNKMGTTLPDAYGVDGSAIDTGYDVDGEVVFTKQPDYSRPTVSTIGGSVSYSNTQGIDVHGDTLAVWNGSGSIRLLNVNTLSSIATISTGSSVHGNDISFSTEYYADGDPFPLLYVDSNPCFRIQNSGGSWSATLIYSLRTPNVYGMKIADSFNGNTLITIGYSENRYTYTDTNKLIIAKWDMTDLTDNGDGTYTPALLGTVTRDWLECIQGASYHDGYLWVASGLENAPLNGRVYALDLDTGDIVYNIDLGSAHELEGLAWAYNSTDGWYMIFGQVSVGFRKITFA